MNKTILIYISLYSISLWISFFGCINSGFFSGDLDGIKISIDHYELLSIAIVYQLVIIFSYYFFRLVSRYNFTLGKLRIEIVKSRFSVLLFFILLIHILFFLYTGVGKVFGTNTNFFSPIFSMTAPSAIFSFYYLMVREYGGRLFYINLLLFTTLELLKGWSGFLLTIFIFEIYFYIKRNSESSMLKIPILYSIILPLIFLLSGGFIYKHVYILKNDIRGISISNDSFGYIDAVEMLSNRLTNFPTAAGVYSRFDSVVDIAKKQDEFAELKGFFRPIVPSFVMEDKKFSALNNSAMLAFFPDYRSDSSVDLGFVMYYYVLFESRIFDAYISLFLSFILGLMLCVVLKLLSGNNDNINLLIFIMVFSLLYTSSNEMVFSRGGLVILFYIPVLFMFGVAKLRTNRIIVS